MYPQWGVGTFLDEVGGRALGLVREDLQKQAISGL